MSFGKETYKSFTENKSNNIKLLYEKYAKKLLAYTIKNFTISKDDAWTIVYKTIYQIAEVTPDYSFENEQKFSGFIFKTHINYLRNFFRDDRSFEKKHAEVVLSDELAEREEAPPSQNIQLKILQQELDKLEDWQRILLLMRGQDMPYSTISKYVDKPESQLKVYYARLKKQLAENVNKQLCDSKNEEHVK